MSQEDAISLIEILKEIKETSDSFPFPQIGEGKRMNLRSIDGKHNFIVDINRKGNINFSKKCTYQGRYQRDIILLRLDIDGPEHTDPDGEILPRTHLHVYREGFGDRYAIAVPSDFINTEDLIQTLIDFLVYFNTSNAHSIDIETVI